MVSASFAVESRAGDAIFQRAPSLAPRGGAPGPGRSSAHPAEQRRIQRRRMDAFAARQQIEARAGVRSILRDLDRRPELEAAVRSGDPQALERVRRKALAEEDLDELRNLQDWRALERWAGQPLGPVTFRLLQENAIRLGASQRRSEVSRQIHALESEITPDTPGLSELAPPRH
jgi:hypothetical protein